MWFDVLNFLKVQFLFILGFFAIKACKRIIRHVTHAELRRELREKANTKKDKEQEYIQNQITNLTNELELEQVEYLLKLNGPDLLQEIRNKKLDPSLVLKIYLYNACKVTKKLNCITEIIKDCRETAEKLNFKDSDKLPLYGIPVSLKETFATKGAPSTIGYAKYLDNIAIDDCVLAKVLKQCGAVPFAKTNVSHMTLSFEGSNPIFGETSNPHNTDFVAGGSSSGEGSIVGGGASVLGFGTDTGGSVRVPSYMCGIVGLKPTHGRISLNGVAPPYAMTIINTSPGPMARDVDTVVMAMKAICCDKMFNLDPNVVPIDFRDELYESRQPMRIGYFDDNGFLKPIPACQRAVKMAKEALEGAGHILIPFQVPDVENIMNVITMALFADGGKTCLETLEDDLVDERLTPLVNKWKMPWMVKKMYAAFLKLKSKRMADDVLALGVNGDPSTYNLWQLRMKLEQYKSQFWQLWSEKHKLDGMICPMSPLVACPKGKLANTSSMMSYTVLFNAINYPAGNVPVSKVTQKDIDDLKNYKGHYEDDWDKHVKTACVESINMPIGVQCVSSPYNEETCLRLMKEVETLLPMKKDQ